MNDASDADPLVVTPDVDMVPMSEVHPTATGLSEATNHVRAVVECLALLLCGLLVIRTFVAEAYIVPTGSMAPTLLGNHREYRCPNYGATFSIGLEDGGASRVPSCPNCGVEELTGTPATEREGDRLLVLKHLYQFRPPRRWEVVVFQNPANPQQAYVKRIVGLPGEVIEIRDGDVFIDGRIARKTLEEQRATRILVHDQEFEAKDVARYPRWVPRPSRLNRESTSSWQSSGNGFLHELAADREQYQADWLEYHHWDSGRGHYGPVRDDTPYNGTRRSGDVMIGDLMFTARIKVAPDLKALSIRFQTAKGTLFVSVPTHEDGAIEVRRDGRPVLPPARRSRVKAEPWFHGDWQRLETSWMDDRLILAIDGELLFDPVDFDAFTDVRLSSRPSTQPPVSLGVTGTGIEVQDCKVYRDIHYTSVGGDPLQRLHGVDRPCRLADREFFVLGDNSPVSFDSRFWPGGPFLNESLLIGKPFLVHLPSRGLPLKVFGDHTYWIPDPREIRYIR